MPEPSSARVPVAVMRAHVGWQWEQVSAWPQPYSATWRLERSYGEVRYLKVASLDRTAEETARLRWAAPCLPVPRLIDSGEEDDVAWFLTEALPGRDATAEEFRSDPEALVDILANGLREFHEAAPAETCPFDFVLDTALGVVRNRVAAELVNPVEDFHREHRHLDAASALAELERTRPEGEHLVVCHGDYCLPNVLIQGDRATGYVDIGELGVADRWSDIAVGAWSVTWNLGEGYEDRFYASYGANPDPDRIAFYRLLYEMVS